MRWWVAFLLPGASALNDKGVSWLRARQLCFLGRHLLESGEIIGILKKFKDGHAR